MDAFVLRPMDLITIGLIIMVILLLIRSFVLGSKVKKLRKAYMQFMGASGVENLEQVIIDLKNQIDQQEENLEKLAGKAETMSRALKLKKGNVGIHRYNAFAERGNDLSFSLAIVNDLQDGLVLSGLHSRDHTFVYAKPVKQGQSEYTLTPEEKEAISLASRLES